MATDGLHALVGLPVRAIHLCLPLADLDRAEFDWHSLVKFGIANYQPQRVFQVVA